MNGKIVLTIILILQILAIGGIVIYAFVTDWSKSRPSNVEQQDTPGVTDQIGAKIVSIRNGDNMEIQTFSVSELALDYLSVDSKIIVMGDDGIKHYNGSGTNTTHCRVHIYLQSDINAANGARYALSCFAINPVISNLPSLPFGNSEITIETEVKKDNLYHSKMEDTTTGITLDIDTYEALLQILQYYAGDGDHDDYLNDPLEDSSIGHNFTIADPHFAPL